MFISKINNFKESLTDNEVSKENSMHVKKTLSHQSEMLRFYNIKLNKYLNKKLMKNKKYFKNSYTLNNRKDQEESLNKDYSKFQVSEKRNDHFYNGVLRNNLILANDDQQQNLDRNEELYYDYEEYYYDQNDYENDYIGIYRDSFDLNKSISKSIQISSYKNDFFYISNKCCTIIIKSEFFFYIFILSFSRYF